MDRKNKKIKNKNDKVFLKFYKYNTLKMGKIVLQGRKINTITRELFDEYQDRLEPYIKAKYIAIMPQESVERQTKKIVDGYELIQSPILEEMRMELDEEEVVEEQEVVQSTTGERTTEQGAYRTGGGSEF